MNTVLQDDLPRVKTEIEAMKNLSHQHVCRLYHVIETPSKIYMVLEVCVWYNLLETLIYHDTNMCRSNIVPLLGMFLIHAVAVKYIFSIYCICVFFVCLFSPSPSVLSRRRAVRLHRRERPSDGGGDPCVLPSDRIGTGLRPQSGIRPPWPQACTLANPCVCFKL